MNLSDIDVSFLYGDGDETERQEVIRNVQTILATPKGTCPMYRDFGVDDTSVDYPLDVAKNLLAVEIMEAVEKWEDRVQVGSVTFEPDAVNGQLKAKVVISWTT